MNKIDEIIKATASTGNNTTPPPFTKIETFIPPSETTNKTSPTQQQLENMADVERYKELDTLIKGIRAEIQAEKEVQAKLSGNDPKNNMADATNIKSSKPLDKTIVNAPKKEQQWIKSNNPLVAPRYETKIEAAVRYEREMKEYTKTRKYEEQKRAEEISSHIFEAVISFASLFPSPAKPFLIGLGILLDTKGAITEKSPSNMAQLGTGAAGLIGYSDILRNTKLGKAGKALDTFFDAFGYINVGMDILGDENSDHIIKSLWGEMKNLRNKGELTDEELKIIEERIKKYEANNKSSNK
jgi:hypothetical protein